ncbi:MAG: transketolase C-terminal domain-containing protein, partial [Pseudomonadota bacterium]
FFCRLLVTKKGHGYPPAEASEDKYHGVSKFNITTGKMVQSKTNKQSYTNVFADHLCQFAKDDRHICAITAAMPSGTGLSMFANKFPDRCFDVGIAEQHGVTFAAGLACEGWKPFVAIYSTFLQRAYDQIVHDVAIQNLPVRFAIDRAGLVGADGATHAGAYDVSMLVSLPNFVVMAPSNENELARMVKTAALYDEGPIAFRYPRGEVVGVTIDEPVEILEIGKGHIVKEGQDIAILNFGTRLADVFKACHLVESQDIYPTIADMRFAKPLDIQLIKDLALNHRYFISIEENAQGGFSAMILNALVAHQLLAKIKFLPLFLPDFFIEQATPEKQYEIAKLDPKTIAKKITEIVGQ